MEHRFVRPDASAVEDVGSGVRLLHFDDGDIRVEHVCARWADPDEPDGVFVKIIAPGLSLGHSVTARRPTTIEPSILCSSCGLHGWVRAGAWVAA